MIAILGVLMLPAVATIAPLFIMLNSVMLDLRDLGRSTCAASLSASRLAVISGAAAVRDLEPEGLPRHDPEGARGGGRGRRRDAEPDRSSAIVLPLATPALAVTAFLGFLAGWTEFYFVSIFLDDPARAARCRSR